MARKTRLTGAEIRLYFVIAFAVGRGVLEIFRSDPGQEPIRKPLQVHAPLTVGAPVPPVGVVEALIEEPPVKPNSHYSGSAFALSRSGHWGTAKHVLEGCNRADAELENGRGGFSRVAVTGWRAVAGTDVAVMETDAGSPGLPLAGKRVQVDDPGFFFGYPKGNANAGFAVNIGKARMVRQRAGDREPADVWAIYEFRPAATIELGGNSGGPMLNQRGEVVGVISAGSDRRGRVLTSQIPALAPLKGYSRPEYRSLRALMRENFVEYGAELRRRGLVVRVDCRT